MVLYGKIWLIYSHSYITLSLTAQVWTRLFYCTESNISNFCRHTGIPVLWTQDLGAGFWTLDSGPWTLDAGLWTLDSGLCALNLGLWTLVSGCWTPFITSFLNSTLIKIFGHFRYEHLSTVYSFQATLSNHLKISKSWWCGEGRSTWNGLIWSFVSVKAQTMRYTLAVNFFHFF